LFGRVQNLVTRAKNFGEQTDIYNGFDLTVTFRFHEVSKYWSATDHVYDVAAWYVSDRRWKSLTKEQQELFRRAAQAGGKVATDLGEQFDRQGMEELKKQGVTYVVPDKAAFEVAWKDVYKSYEGKVWPTGLVERLKAAQQ